MTDLRRSMHLSDVIRLARQAVSEATVHHEVVGVSVGGRGSDCVEIVVAPHDPCGDSRLFVVGAFRNVSEMSFRRDIISRLQRRADSR